MRYLQTAKDQGQEASPQPKSLAFVWSIIGIPLTHYTDFGVYCVQCDERKPICGNCAKHGVDCDYVLSDAVAASPTPHTGPRSASAATPGHASASGVQASSADEHESLLRIPALESIHLELLHNYTTLTSQTLSEDPLLKTVWRINVPKVGFVYDFVMRSIFALSALHTSLFAADKKGFYLNVARAEHGAALREITLTLSNVTAENCSALYIAAALTFFYAWASPRQPGDFFLVSNTGAAEWVFLLQGVRSISENWRAALLKGPFSPMLRLGEDRMGNLARHCRRSAAWLSTVEHAQLAYLRRAVVQAAPDAETTAIYEQNIDRLETSFCSIFGVTRNAVNSPVASSPSSLRDPGDRSGLTVALTSNVYSWVYRLDDAFIELLIKRDPLALVIFAHFCVLLKFLGSCWWMQGWSTHLMQEIWDLLDEEHRLWICWPIEELGWRPKAT